jgi:hypothetical protein
MSDTSLLSESDRALLQREQAFDALKRTCEALHGKIDATELAKTGLNVALDLTGAEGGAIFVREATTRARKVLSSAGRYEDPDRLARRNDDKLFREIMRGGRARLTSVEPQTISVSAWPERIVIPLKRWDGPPIGVIDLVDSRKGWLEETDVALLTIVSALTAGAIERTLRHSCQANREIERLVTFLELALAHVSRKDHYNGSQG